MNIRTCLLTAIILASISVIPIRSHAGARNQADWPRPELTHPELFKLHLINKTFKCGDAELMSESACFFTTGSPDRQCRKQTIKLVNLRKGITRKLPLDGKTVKKNFKESPGPVLDTVVTSLGCIESKSGKHYIILWYDCNWGRACYGTNREWQRYFTDDGINLTTGKPDKVNYYQILKKYGIPEAGGSYIELTSKSDK